MTILANKIKQPPILFRVRGSINMAAYDIITFLTQFSRTGKMKRERRSADEGIIIVDGNDNVLHE